VTDTLSLTSGSKLGSGGIVMMAWVRPNCDTTREERPRYQDDSQCTPVASTTTHTHTCRFTNVRLLVNMNGFT
jgi:hypothetical protein